MPATFFHPVFGYMINRFKPQFNLPALIVGSILPDIEVIPIYFLTNGVIDRLIFHSFIGAVTIGTLLTLGLVMFVYPYLISFLFKINIFEIKKKCRFSALLTISCMIGNLSHILIDSTTHEYNPLLYPISRESINFFRISNDRGFDNLIITIILALIILVIVFVSLRKGTKLFWKKMLLDQNINN